MLQDRKIDCLQARSCIFQPGNNTGWAAAKGLNVCRGLSYFSLFVSNKNTQAALSMLKNSQHVNSLSSWSAGPHSYLSARNTRPLGLLGHTVTCLPAKLVLLVRWATIACLPENSSS